MLKTYRICNLTIEFSKCEFNNKLLSSVNPTLFFDGSYGFTLVLYSSYIASLHPRNLPKGFFFFFFLVVNDIGICEVILYLITKIL